MPTLKLFFLGPPRIEFEGQPIKVDTRKATALLAYLAVTGTYHSRDSLALMLWPDYDQSRARAALRRTLSALNKALSGQWLEIEREGLQITPGFWLDVAHFEEKLQGCNDDSHRADGVCPGCLTTWTEAIQLYRDDFLAGFTLRDSSNFDDWQFFQAEELRQRLISGLEQVVKAYTAQENWSEAITYTRQWLALDTLHEPAHRHLMQLYAQTDQRTAALRQYRKCVRILEQELGVPPLEETTQLYTAILENQEVVKFTTRKISDDTIPSPTSQPAISPQPVSTPAPIEPAAPLSPQPTATTLPLVDRQQEWSTLLETYRAIKNNGHFIVLEGEAGIGKTRLAEEFLTHIKQKGARVITTRCYEGEANLAYGPFVDGLRTLLSSVAPSEPRQAEFAIPWLGEVARLLPELLNSHPNLPPPPPLDSPGAQAHFFEGVYQFLLQFCNQTKPGIFFIDNLHWADEASLDLLFYLVRRLRDRPLFYLAAWRQEQVPSNHRLRQLLGELQRSGLGTLLTLPRLSQTAVLELVEKSGLTRGGDLGMRLFAETEGLPFFLVEYLNVLLDKNVELPSGPNSSEDEWAMPHTVRDLLHSRLRIVSETGSQLLTTAAIIGRSFEFETLRAASGRSEEETITSLEQLIRLGLISEVQLADREPTYDFTHEKLRELVYEETSLARRRLLHRRVAEALSHRPTASDIGTITSQIARHYQNAGQENIAAEYFKTAGEQARHLFANTEALSHFRSALALGYPQAANLHQAIGDLQTLSGEYNEALTSYETAAALSEADDLIQIEHKLGEVHHRRGDWDLAESHFQAAVAALQERPTSTQSSLQARLYADWSHTAYRQGDTPQAVGLAERALNLAEQIDDGQALAQAHNILGILANSEQNLAEARYHLQQSLALAKQLAEPTAEVAALNNLAFTYSAGQDYETALTLTAEALALCTSQGDRHREAALHNNLADLHHHLAQPEAAMTHLKQAVTIFAEIGAEVGGRQPEIWKLVEW